MKNGRLLTQSMSRLKTGAAFTAAGLAAITLVKNFEGYRPNAYRDSVGVPTICFGETRGVRMGDKKTKAECEKMLGNRLIEFETEMRKCLRNPDALPDPVYISSLSFTYNVGSKAFCNSSVRYYLNEGKIRKACDSFLNFTRAGKTYPPGLLKRRQEERALCLKGAV